MANVIALLQVRDVKRLPVLNMAFSKSRKEDGEQCPFRIK
jgi:hypothetical protein